MSFNTPSRRAVVRTAAWSVPAVTLASTAPAFAASTPTYGPAGPTSFPYTSQYGPFDVEIKSSHVPLTAAVGDSLDAPDFTATIVIPANLVDVLNSIGIVAVGGEAVTSYSGAGTTATLTVPRTPVPASGPMTLTPSGQGEASSATTAGSIAIVIGDIAANLELENSAGATSPFPIALTPASAPNVFHTYTVA